MRSPTAPLGLALCLAALVGCERRTPQCNEFVDAINEEQAKMGEILKAAGGPNPDSESLEAYAKANDELVARLRRLKVKDARVETFRERYIELTQGLSTAVRKTSAKLESPRDANKAAEEVKAFTPKKRELEKAINDFCRGKTD
jgi:hypothetical protein